MLFLSLIFIHALNELLCVNFESTWEKVACIFLHALLCIFFSRVFSTCQLSVNCMQYGVFSRRKHLCNADIPAACTVLLGEGEQNEQQGNQLLGEEKDRPGFRRHEETVGQMSDRLCL